MRGNTARRQSSVSGRRSYMYMHTSAAPVFPQEDYSYEQPRKKKRIKPDSNYDYVRVDEEKNTNIFTFAMPFAAIVFFAMAVLVVNACISSVKTEIKETHDLTEKTKAVNENLEVILSENIDLEEVKKTATTRLGMQTAAPHQIVKINVQKDSYSVSYDDEVADDKNRTFLEKIGITKKD